MKKDRENFLKNNIRKVFRAQRYRSLDLEFQPGSNTIYKKDSY